MRAIALLILIPVLVAGVAVAGGRMEPVPAGDAYGNAFRPLAPGIHVGGQVTGLYPGARRRLRARVINSHPFPVELRSVRAEVADAGPGCDAGNITVRRYGGHRLIPAQTSRRVGLRVRMHADAADECRGATFPLSLHASARADGG